MSNSQRACVLMSSVDFFRARNLSRCPREGNECHRWHYLGLGLVWAGRVFWVAWVLHAAGVLMLVIFPGL